MVLSRQGRHLTRGVPSPVTPSSPMKSTSHGKIRLAFPALSAYTAEWVRSRKAPALLRPFRQCLSLLLVMPSLIAPVRSAGAAQATEDSVTAVRNLGTPAESHCKLELVRELTLGVENTPENQVFASILSYGVSNSGTIYILDSIDRAISAFAETGEFVQRFGRRGKGPGEFESPSRLYLIRDTVFVYDRDLGRIVRFTPNGKHIDTRVLPEYSTRAIPFLAGGKNGHLYVTGHVLDGRYGGAAIHVLDRELHIIRTFGQHPEVPDDDSAPYLATGSVAVDSSGSVWFAPLSSYEIRRYSGSGELEALVTRENDFDFHPRPYVVRRELPGGNRATVGFDTNRAFLIRMHIDAAQRLWVFVRDNPRDQMVVDLFSPAGKYLQRHSFPLRNAPSNLDSQGRFYSITTELGFPQLIRYGARVTSIKRGMKCSDVL